MSTTIATIYAMLLHVAGIAAVVVLLALGKIDSTVGVSLLSGLLGIGVGAGTALLTPTPPPVSPVGAAPVVATASAAPAVAPSEVVPHLAGA